MVRRAWPVVVLVAAGCGSTEASRAPDRSSGVVGADDADRVVIPPEVMSQLEAWMAREVTLIADVIEIDATRLPFASQIATEATRETDSEGRRLVERKETIDFATRIATLTLTNRSGFKTTIETMPRIRLGGGRQFIATDHLVVRYVPIEGSSHPVSLTVVAKGKVRLVEASPERRVAGSTIVLRADVVTGPGGYEFRDAEQRQP